MPEPVEKKSGQEQVTEFFNNLPRELPKQDIDIFGTKPKEVVADIVGTADDEEVDDSIKNRRHRRLEQKIDALRDENIQLGERVKMLSEVEKFTKENPDVDPDIARMFDNTDIGKENALRLSRKLEQIQEKAEERALARIDQLKDKEKEEFNEASGFIDSELERLEEAYGVKLTPGTKQTTEFLQLVEDLSPKDEEGNLKDYADFETTFELYQSLSKKEKPDNSRAREVASRSMQRSQSSAPVAKPRSPGWDGWKKDMGIE